MGRQRRGALACAALAVALVPVPARAEPTRIRFAFTAAGAADHDDLVATVEAWSSTQDEVVVEPISRLWTAYDVHETLVRFLALQDPAIDVLQVDVSWLAELADPGWLLPLDGLLPEDPDRTFVPEALAGGRYRGRLYGVPAFLQGNLLYYRRDLLEAEGLEPPRTLEELGRQARLLRERGAVAVGVALHGAHLYNDYLPMLWAGGGEVLDEDNRALLAGDAAVEALAGLAALFRGSPTAAPSPEELVGAFSDYRHALEVFERGDAAFAVDWSSNAQRFEAEGAPLRGRVGVARVPGARGPGPSNLGSFYLVVNRASRHPEAALALVAHLSSATVQRSRYDAIGLLPSREDLYDEGSGLRDGPHVDELRQALRGARIRPRPANGRAVGDILDEALLDAIAGRSTPEEAIGRAAARLEEARVPPLDAAEPGEATGLDPRRGAETEAEQALGRVPAALLGAALLLPAATLLLLLARRRLGLRVLDRLSRKLVLAGSLLIVELMLVSAAFQTSQALALQREDLERSRAFLVGQMAEHATTVAKSLALSSSIVADLEAPDRAGARLAREQLLMAAHFSEDVVLLQLLGPRGEVVEDARQVLYRGSAEGLGAASSDPPAREIGALVARRTTLVRERRAEDGIRYLDVLVPVFRRGVHAGALRLGVSERRLDERLRGIGERHEARIRRSLAVAGGTTAALLCLGIAGITALSRRVTRPVEELTETARRIRGGDLEVEVEVRGRDEVGALARTMAEMVQGLRDRDFVRSTLGRYVDEEVAARFLSDRESLRLGGHLARVTILMADIRGFTALCERTGPEATVVMLNRHLGAMTEVVREHGGMVDEILGDAVLALFGAIEEREDDALRAVRCGVAMQHALAELNREGSRRGLPRLAMGVGLSSGVVVAGNIGSERRAKYGVVGAPVNLAARVESFAAPGDVLLSEETLASTRDHVETGEPVTVRFKGKEEPVRLFPVRRVGGGPELRLPVEGGAGRVAVSFEADCFLLRGKELEPEPAAARVVELGPDGLVLEVDGALAPLSDVLVVLRAGPGRVVDGLYAKVTAVDGATGRATVAFASLVPEAGRALEALLAEAAEARTERP